MHDRASVNGAAVRIVKVVYPCMVDIGCISHTLDIVGDKFKTPTLNHSYTLWNSLFSHSFKARATWKRQTDRAMPSGTKTRWWSRWEMMEQMMQQFGDMELYLHQADFSPSTCLKLLEILSNPQSRLLLRIELAAVVDVGVHFVKGTYNLEGGWNSRSYLLPGNFVNSKCNFSRLFSKSDSCLSRSMSHRSYNSTAAYSRWKTMR